MVTALRHKLSEITETAPVQEHPARIEALQSKHGHTITVVDSEYPIERYTCGVHAFYLIEDPTYVEIAGFGLSRTFAGPEFIDFLVQNELLSPRQQPIVPGDLIVYFDGDTFRHVERMKTEARVLSKWGTGWLFEHGVWEVPSNYGETIQYFVGPDEDASFELFIQYAESKGFQFGVPTHA
jgi:hypothetical protein